MYNISVKSQEKIKKYFNNSLDNHIIICYNVSVDERRRSYGKN